MWGGAQAEAGGQRHSGSKPCAASSHDVAFGPSFSSPFPRRAADGKESMSPPSAASGVRLSPGKARAGMGRAQLPWPDRASLCFAWDAAARSGKRAPKETKTRSVRSVAAHRDSSPVQSRPCSWRGLKKCQGARTQLPGHSRECACNLPSRALNRAAPARETPARPTATARLARAVLPLSFPRPLLCPPQYFSGTSHSASRSEIAPRDTALLSAVPYKDAQ